MKLYIMQNFIFQNPVKILFGKGMTSKISGLIPAKAKILLLYGGGSVKKNGSYDQTVAAIGKRKFVEFSGIEPNPEYATCMKAVKLIKDKKIDFIIALGGGSGIDACKFISAAALYKGKDPWDILEKDLPVKEALPFGTVLTLPATGSEMNMNAVVSRREICKKLSFASEKVFPQFSVLDPTFTFTLPARQTRNGVIDAFVHVMEQYLTRPANAEIQDRFSESIAQTLVKEGPIALKKPEDYDCRANIMFAATMALNHLICCGVPQDWSSHLIGHEITALYGLDHAETLAIVMPKVLEYKKAQKLDKLVQLGARVVNRDNAAVHVSGHCNEGELLYMYNIVKPKNAMPIHGENRHLVANGLIAVKTGIEPENVVLAEDGDVVDLYHGKAAIVGSVPCGYIYVDGDSVGELTDDELEKRRILGSEGFVSCFAVVDTDAKDVISGPKVYLNAVAEDEKSFEKVRHQIIEQLQDAMMGGTKDVHKLQQIMRRTLGSWVARELHRKPMIVPVVADVAADMESMETYSD